VSNFDQCVIQYLHSGHVWDPKKAQNFLGQKLLGIDGVQYVDAAKHRTAGVLEACVAEAVMESGKSRVLLPLTGGLDSRSILAGYLANYRKENIACCTVGSDDDADVRAAAGLCSKLGLEWVRLDPAGFDLGQLAYIASRIAEKSGSYSLSTGLVMRIPILELARKTDSTVLTGWGGTIVGSKLSNEIINLSTEDQVKLFLKGSKKSNLPIDVDLDYLDRICSETIAKARNTLPDTCRITDFELLRFAFPMQMRVQGSVNAIFDRSPSPFVRDYWIAHWYGRSATDRVQRTAFATEMRNRFLEIFSSWRAPVRRHAIARLLDRAMTKVSKPRKAANHSLNQAYWEAKEIINAADFGSSVMRVIEDNYDKEEVLISDRSKRWMVSLAMHIRAGTLKAGSETGGTSK